MVEMLFAVALITIYLVYLSLTFFPFFRLKWTCLTCILCDGFHLIFVRHADVIYLHDQ